MLRVGPNCALLGMTQILPTYLRRFLQVSVFSQSAIHFSISKSTRETRTFVSAADMHFLGRHEDDVKT